MARAAPNALVGIPATCYEQTMSSEPCPVDYTEVDISVLSRTEDSVRVVLMGWHELIGATVLGRRSGWTGLRLTIALPHRVAMPSLETRFGPIGRPIVAKIGWAGSGHDPQGVESFI